METNSIISFINFQVFCGIGFINLFSILFNIFIRKYEQHAI